MKRTNKFEQLHRILAMVLTAVLCLGLVSAYGCRTTGQNGEESSEKEVNYVYFLNRDKTRVQGEIFVFTTDTPAEQFQEMAKALASTPKHNECKTSLGKDFKILGYDIKDGNLTLNMDAAYKKLSSTEEILVRAALVRSFVQVVDINYVQFMVEGENLLDAGGMAVGYMNADSFIENDGKEINVYERANVTLYFATEDGEHLVAGQRQVIYNTNVSMEKMVMEQLIKGPSLAGYFPTINPETKILSVTNKDGTCYVNLSEEFLKQPYNVSTDVVIYSIANSLIDLPSVSRVQIQVGGSSKILYRETKSLEDPIERNLDIMLKEE